MGLGLASCLLKAGDHVDLIARQATVEALRKKGLNRTGIFGDFHADNDRFGSFSCLDDLPPRRYDYILVCVKSFASAGAADDLAAHEDPRWKNPAIVLCQNGWGNAEVFAGRFPKSRIYNARVITGFERSEPNTVVITVHADDIHIGSLYGGDVSRTDALCRAICDGGVPCRTTGAIGKDLWAKMLYNCALNALGAILDCPYGALAANEATRFLMDRLAHEVFMVMEAAGHQTHFGDSRAFLDAFYDRLVPATVEHRSSTLQDIQAGRRTEIDALNGAVIELAQQYKADVPYNRTVYHLVKFLEAMAGRA